MQVYHRGFQAAVKQPSRDDLLLSPPLACYLRLLCAYECEQENVSVMVHRVSSSARLFLCPYLGWLIEGKKEGAIRSGRGEMLHLFYPPTHLSRVAAVRLSPCPLLMRGDRGLGFYYGR